jgi:hypothetical protein
MASKIKKDYSWKEKYDHVFHCYCSLWNSALNFIAQNYGNEALDQYLDVCMGKDVLGRSAFPEMKEGIDTEAFLNQCLAHHVMIGSEFNIVKAEQDEIIIDFVKCGSKGLVVEKFGEGAQHYCRHCEILSLWEQMGWSSEVDRSRAGKLEGQNIGCRRIFRRMKR